MIWCQACFRRGQSDLKSLVQQLVRNAARVSTYAAILFHLPLVAAPFIFRQPTNQMAMPGQNVVFNVGVTGAPPFSFQWRKDLTNLFSATNANLFLPNVQMGNAGRYSVLVTDTSGSIMSSQGMLVVSVPVSIAQQPVPQTVPLGGSASFFVSATGGPPFTYQWVFNGTAIGGATNQSVSMGPVTAGDAGNYSARVWNSFGNFADSVPASLAIAGSPPSFTMQPASRSVPAGTDVSMNVAAAGSQPLSLQWIFKGAPLEGATNDTLSFTPAQPMHAGNYTVLASNSYGTALSDPAHLEVMLPALPFADNFADAMNFQSTMAISGQGVTFGATLEPLEPYHDGRRTDHSIWLAWTAPSDGITTINTLGSDFDTVLAVYIGSSLDFLFPVESNDDSDTDYSSALSFNAVGGVTYRIAVAGHLHSQGTVLFDLRLTPTPERLPVFVSHPQSRSVTPGANVSMSFNLDSLEPVQIQWIFRGLDLPNATSYSNDFSGIDESRVGPYRVKVTTPTHVVYSRYADLQINSRGASNVMARDKLGDAMDSGLYLAPATLLNLPVSGGKSAGGGSGPKSGGSGSRGYTTTQIFSTAGASTDPGEPVHCGVGAGKSEWYAYQAEAHGTLRIDTDGSSFNTVLAVYIGPGDSYATLTNVACDNNSGSNGLTSKVIFTATSNTIYWIAVDGVSNASPQSGTVKLHINLGNPVTIGTQPQDVTSPSGSNASFTVSANGMTNYTYQWRFGGTNLAGATSASFTRTNVLSAQAGSYDVVVMNPINSVTSSVATLTIYSGTLNITNQPQNRTGVVGTNITFTVGASGAAPLGYQWRLNGTNLPAKTNNTLALNNIQPANAGTYSVNVSDANGSLASSNATLTVWVAPGITLQPISQSAAPGSVVTLTAAASGSPLPAYQWFFNGAALPGATLATLNLSNFQGATAGEYSMVASNLVGLAQTVGAEVLLNSPVRFTNLWCSNGTFNARLIGAANTSYALQWSTNLTAWTGQLTNSSSSGIIPFSAVMTNDGLKSWRAVSTP